jgi:hypothetical protein
VAQAALQIRIGASRRRLRQGRQHLVAQRAKVAVAEEGGLAAAQGLDHGPDQAFLALGAQGRDHRLDRVVALAPRQGERRLSTR